MGLRDSNSAGRSVATRPARTDTNPLHAAADGGVCDTTGMGPAANGEERPTGTVTFLFTDVEGSTKLWAADRVGMSASLVLHDSIVRGTIEDHGGYVFTTAGDSFAAVFQRAPDAFRAAVTVQTRLGGAPWPGPSLRVRMGLHLGEAEERGGDFFGPDVNTAARVEDAGHGGQVLITEAVKSAAAAAVPDADLTDLGTHRLRDVPEPLRLFQVGHESFPMLRVVDPGLSNLPVRPTRLIGRDTDVGLVRRLLLDHRLVTITALGGSGKTRIAIAVGEAEMAHRVGGVWFVDLTTISKDDEVPRAVASAVGLNLSAGDPVAQVIEFLADKPALVILDNCEHLIDACALFVTRFLSARGLASILATSREVLDIDGEHTVVLAPLPSDSADSPAVRLFAERATSIDSKFVLNDASVITVAAICARLDGMPLAIELAAARVTVLNLTQLLVGLDNRFELLAGGRRGQRQRTLQATLDWSYDLLDPDEQRVLRRLGVFADGFDLDAVAAVTNTPQPVALQVIRALIAKSLVVRSDREGATRFRLLETVKAYAEQRLGDAGEANTVRDRHLEYFHRVVAAPGRIIHAELELSARMRPDHHNLGVAFSRATSLGDWTRAGELLLAAAGVYEMDAVWFDAVTMFDRVLQHGEALESDLVERLKAASLLFLGGIGDSRFGDAARGLRDSSVSAVRAYAWTWAGWVNVYLGESATEQFDQAQAAAEHFLASDTEPINATVRSNLLGVRGFSAAKIGNYDGALQWYLQANAANAAYPTVANVGATLGGIAVCQILNGQPAAALDTITLLESHSITWRRGDDLRALAHLALGDVVQAMHHVRLITEHGLTGRIWGEASNCLIVHAFVHAAENNPGRARDLFTHITAPTGTVGIIYASHAARQLGITDALRQRILDHVNCTPDQQRSRYANTMAALRAETTLRGWT